MLAKKPEIAQTIITNPYPIEDAPEAFRVAGERSAGAIKVVVEPSPAITASVFSSAP